MRNLFIFLLLVCFVTNIYASNVNEYVNVSFNPSATPTRWASTAQELYNQTSSSSSSSSESWSGQTSSQFVETILLEDRDNSGGITAYDWVRDVYNTTETGTRSTTTTTTTSTTTASAVNMVFTVWDIVDAGSAFTWNEEEFLQRSNWAQKWNKKTDAQATSSNSFQIRRDTEQQVRDDVSSLNTLYANLFTVEENIERLIASIQSYRSNPEQDKQHTALMSQLAKLRKEQFNLKSDIREKRAEVFSEQGTDLLGWTLSTNVTTNVSTTTSGISRTTITGTEHNICFVSSTELTEGCTIEEAWKNGMTLAAGKLVRSDYYTGLVYMFYDANGRALLPGSVTYNHLLLTTDMLQKKRACDIQKGDRLICGSNEIVTVDRIETTSYQGYVYNVGNNYELFSFHPDYVMTAGIAAKE